jgi:polysaccharide pyruvyl transferase WcaK-like protein
LLNGASGIFVRDIQSKEELGNFQIGNDKIKQTYESVIGLSDLFTDYVIPSKREQILGISIYSTQVRKKLEYIRTTGAFINHAIEKGFKVRIFPMELKDAGSDDRPLIYDILDYVHDRGQCIVEETDLDTLTHLAEISKCRVFVGHKTHSIIFALTTGTPVVALAYHSKAEDFMNQYELNAYCIPDSELTDNRLINTFDEVCSKIDTLGSQIFDKSREYGNAVRKDFGQMIERYRETPNERIKS